MAKFYTEKRTINGVEYTAQFSGVSTALNAADQSYLDNSRNTSSGKYAQYILDHVIVEPKGLTVDDFDSVEELTDVTSFGSEVMNGKSFRNKKDEGAAGAKNKE